MISSSPPLLPLLTVPLPLPPPPRLHRYSRVTWNLPCLLRTEGPPLSVSVGASPTRTRSAASSEGPPPNGRTRRTDPARRRHAPSSRGRGRQTGADHATPTSAGPGRKTRPTPRPCCTGISLPPPQAPSLCQGFEKCSPNKARVFHTKPARFLFKKCSTETFSLCLLCQLAFPVNHVKCCRTCSCHVPLPRPQKGRFATPPRGQKATESLFFNTNICNRKRFLCLQIDCCLYTLVCLLACLFQQTIERTKPTTTSLLPKLLLFERGKYTNIAECLGSFLRSPIHVVVT